ncbi:MAG: response regulator transcription factor [Blastocatellia bacterium]|nr:response regulator transcription factor [Blastocatellia bacterium]
MNIRTIIADGSKPSRSRLKTLLNDPEIEIVGEASSGREAVTLIEGSDANLVFLDVEMPEMGGFEVIESVGPGNMPITIIMTERQEFAVEAFERNAVDYLLKPFDKTRVSRSLQYAKEQIKPQIASHELADKLSFALTQIAPSPKYLKRLIVKHRNRTILVPVELINWIAASGNYIQIHTGGETHLVRNSISSVESELDPSKFVRIHRSRIVNIDRVRALRPLSNGDQIIMLDDGTELALSRTYHKGLLAAACT